MDLPLSKEWMSVLPRTSRVYVQGVREFIKFAQSKIYDDIIHCPCTRCRNGKRFPVDDVEFHLIKWGMEDSYRIWVFHGENGSISVPDQPTSRENINVDESHSAQFMLDNLIDDAFDVHQFECNESMGFESRQEKHADVHEDQEYIRLKLNASKPLYPNCNKDHTTLFAMIGLQNVKSQFGLSGNSVTAILLWMKELLPADNLLPTSYPSMKSSLRGLGMNYKSIHACKYDCILYRKEYEFEDKCPVCSEPRFVGKKDPNKKGLRMHKEPQKVLKYFPLGPRLKRLYTVPWISEAMTWHARAERGGNLMRHPIDSTIWKTADVAYPEFANESRNVRLGFATDGFNPFGNLSTNQSVWPVILVPYNLPPSLCMRKEFSMLSLLIPGPKAPSDDIDVFLAPLIEELNVLWLEGVQAFDSNKQEHFILKAMLLWAIHDLPAYGTLSGCNVHGYFGCPICAEETGSDWLPVSHKICYHSHRRWLPRDHKFRRDKSNFIPDGVEERSAPKKLSGSQIEIKAASVTHNLTGKHPKVLALKRKSRVDPKDPNKVKPWSRRSLLYDLPYWKSHSVRHVIDVMHEEKNIVEHIVSTCLQGVHSKDGEKAREDLRVMKIKKSLWLQKDPEGGKTVMPDAAFTLTKDEREVFLKTLHDLKVPTEYSSNLRRVVNFSVHDLRQCKSHDWHIIMQLVPLLFRHCFSKHKELRRAIMQISLCFNLLCEKVVNRKHIVAAKATIFEATCVLEKYFPPAFFDISIHMLVHLCDEALMCGPVRYRWMYPFERLMKSFKDYVKNTRYIGGSIAEAHITNEASLFAREYMPNPGIGSFNPHRERFVDDFGEFADEEALGNGRKVKLSNLQYEQVARYVFETHEDVDEWREKYNSFPRDKRRKVVSNSSSDFRLWVSNELLRMGDVTSRLAQLAKGPSFVAKQFDRYRVKGFVFSQYGREQRRMRNQNSGIAIKAITTCVSSAKDKNPKQVEMVYYGVIQHIYELEYSSFRETVFDCDWVRVEDRNACMVDPATKMVMVDLTKLKSRGSVKDEPFVCAFQNIKQVFYSKCIDNSGWSVVLHAPKRLTNQVDALEAPTDYQSALDDNPNLCDLLDYLDA